MVGCHESEWWIGIVEWNTGMTFDPQNSAQSPLKINDEVTKALL